MNSEELSSSSRLLLDTITKNAQDVKNIDLNNIGDLIPIVMQVVDKTNKEVAQDPKYSKDDVDMMQLFTGIHNIFQRDNTN